MSQHLQIHSPSPSSKSYTITSLSRPRPLASKILRATIRVTIAFYALLVLIYKLRSEDVVFSREAWYDFLVVRVVEYVPGLEGLIGFVLFDVSTNGGSGGIGGGIEERGGVRNLWMVCCVVGLIVWLCARRGYTVESLLVLQGLGVQTSTSSAYYFVSPTTKFISTTQIQDIVIHEAFKGFEVRFYLAIIVVGAPELVVVFPHILPRRAMLEEIWRGSRKCLYGGAG